jgi:hypothetical protein
MKSTPQPDVITTDPVIVKFSDASGPFFSKIEPEGDPIALETGVTTRSQSWYGLEKV